VQCFQKKAFVSFYQGLAVTDPQSPLLLGSLASLVVMLLAGLAAQIIALRKREKSLR